MSQASLIPSFSIVLETENLANASLEGLVKSLASLVNQSLSPSQAQEVILIDSGDTPPDLLTQLCDRYPWIKIYTAPPSTGYYKAKMLGAELATGEVIVYADSDCIYEPQWLHTILETFAHRPDIQIVAGETTTRGRGPYGTAMAMTYIFPQYSGKTTLEPTAQYFLNNVAFRRDFLLANPIPTDLPLYRGNCVIHIHKLGETGHRIWLNPQARATHAPPDGLSHFFWRFLLIGYDYYWQKELIAPENIAPSKNDVQGDPTASSLAEKLRIFRDRISRLFINNPWHIVYFPLAIPIMIAASVLIFVGYQITRLKQDYLLKTYDRILA